MNNLQFRCPVCNTIQGGLTIGHVKKHGYSSIKSFIDDYPQMAVYRMFYTNYTKPDATRSLRVEMAMKVNTNKKKGITI